MAIDRAYFTLIARRDAAAARHRANWLERIGRLTERPRFSVVIPVHDAPVAWLVGAIASVKIQLYPKWEICIADDASTKPTLRVMLDSLERDERIRLVRLERNGGIARATNAACTLATGEWVVFLDQDDTLAEHALAALAEAAQHFPGARLLFSDEDRLDGASPARPYLKPGWNPDLLLVQNAVCHLAAYRRDFLDELGGLREGFDGAQDHDLALRAARAGAATGAIRHVPGVLYHWRESPASLSSRRLDVCLEASRRVAQSFLGGSGSVEPNPEAPLWLRIRFVLPQSCRVAIIGAAPDLARAGLSRDAIIEDERAADILVFLAPDLEPLSQDWLAELAAQALRPEIGVAGGKIVDKRGVVRHAGFFLDPQAIAISFRSAGDPDDAGYRGAFSLLRTVAAVSRDAMAVRREVFERLGGWDQPVGDFADVDFCLRAARDLGLRSVWTPHARFRQDARARPKRHGAETMRARWGNALRQDPYLNPALTLKGGTLRLRKA